MKKERRLKILGIDITDRDWRGVLAFALVLSLALAVLTNNKDGITVLSPLAGAAVGWYFGKKK